MVATALSPRIGYDKTASITEQDRRTGRTIRTIALERTDLTKEESNYLLDPVRMTGS